MEKITSVSLQISRRLTCSFILNSVSVYRLLALLSGTRYRQEFAVPIYQYGWENSVWLVHLPLEKDIISTFKWSIDNIRADDLNVFLLQNLSRHSKSANTGAGWIDWEKKRNLIKHDAVWKDGHQCFVGSTYISSRLSSLYCSDGCNPYPRAYLHSFPGRRACIMFSLRQILSESCPLLLENQAKSKISEEIITEIYSSIST